MGKVRCMLEGIIVAWKGTILIVRRAFVTVRLQCDGKSQSSLVAKINNS